jgi:hypothetical protein
MIGVGYIPYLVIVVAPPMLPTGSVFTRDPCILPNLGQCYITIDFPS